LFAPFEPKYTFQVCPASDTLLATGFGVPSELYWAEIGPALKLASHIMISFTLAPPAVVEVKRSYAISATIVPEVLWDHFHVAGMLLIAESFLLRPELSWMLV